MPQLTINQTHSGGLNKQEKAASVSLIFLFLGLGMLIVFLVVPKAPLSIQMPIALLTFLLLGMLARLLAMRVRSANLSSRQNTTTFLKIILYADIALYYIILDFFVEKQINDNGVFIGLTPEHAIIVGISLLELISNATEMYGKKKPQKKRFFKPLIRASRPQ